MQRAKSKRSAYKKGNEAVDKYVGIIYEIHQQSEKRRATKSITTIAVKNNASKSLGSVMKKLKIVKGRFPYYHWIGGEPNRKMARDILNAMQLYANNDLVKIEAHKKPPTRNAKHKYQDDPRYIEQQKEKNKTVAKKKLILAFESTATSVADACDIANVSEKVFYDYLKTDSEFQMAIVAIGTLKTKLCVERKATPQNEIPTKPQPKPKAQQKPRTISMFWGLIKINF